MNKKNIKPLIMSSLAALSLGSMSVAGTFALFTDQASTTINIDAGKIVLKNTIAITDAKSLRDTQETFTSTSASYVNGGNVTVDNSNTSAVSVNIRKWTPGDSVELTTNPDNAQTNIETLMRVKVVMSGELAPALVVRGSVGTEEVLALSGARTVYSPWTTVHVGANPDTYKFSIAFPDHDNGQILFGEDNKDNQYQDKGAVVSIVYEAVQGNAEVDDLLERANSRLITEMIHDGGANPTMHEAMLDLGTITEAQIKAAGFVWSSEEDLFYRPASISENQYKYFKIANEVTTDGFSIYASSDWETPNIALQDRGFDAGNASGISSIAYTGTDTRSVIIRTNSPSTSLSVQAPQGTVKHYDAIGSVNIISVANSSYHEFGSVAFAEIAKGRIVLEKTSDIDQIHINKKADAESFDEIIIKDAGVLAQNLPDRITRDQVNVGAEKELVVKVVSSQEVTENVYVYPYVDNTTPVGTTHKTEIQNTNVESALGTLVLDAGTDAGENAMNATEKQEAKQEVVTHAIQEACAHEHKHYIVDPANELRHYQVCEDCGKKLTESELHVYDSENVFKCSLCDHENAILYNVTVDGADETLSLSEAIEAYNTNSRQSEDKDYVIELEDGIYEVTPDQYQINQSKVNEGKTLTIKAKHMPADKDGNFGVVIKAKKNSNGSVDFDLNGSSAFFKVSGGSLTTGGGAVTFTGLKFDFSNLADNFPIGSDYKYKINDKDKRLNAVFLMDGGENRYAHDVTMDRCSFQGPAAGGKFSCAISSNKSNSNPTRITIQHCKGDRMNAWFNGYQNMYGSNPTFGLKLDDLDGTNFLIVANPQGGGSVSINDVNGTFLYENHTEWWLLKCIQPINLSITNSSWKLLAAPYNSDASKHGIIDLNLVGTVTATMSGVTIDKGEYTCNDIYREKGSISINGGTAISATTASGVFPVAVQAQEI